MNNDKTRGEKKAKAVKPEIPARPGCTAPSGSFSEALWTAREGAHVTKTEMAIKLGVKPPVVTKMESGRHYVSEETVQRYAAALNLTPKLQLVKPRTASAV